MSVDCQGHIKSVAELVRNLATSLSQVALPIGIVGIKITIFESLQEPNYNNTSGNWKFLNYLGKMLNYENCVYY